MLKIVKIYTTRSCPFCVQAKRLLAGLNIAFEEIGLDENPDLRMQLSKENGGWRTVPMIFFGSAFVGGFDDLKKLHDNGDLFKKLQ